MARIFVDLSICRFVEWPAFKKVYSHKRSLSEHLNSQHTRIESRDRRTATGASQPKHPFPILDVFEQEATTILFKHPGSYGNIIPDSQADSDEQFRATAIEETDKYVQTPQNVPDDEGSEASSGRMDFDPVDARSDHSQFRASLDEQCDGTDTEARSNDAQTLESISDEESDTSLTSMEVDDNLDSSSDCSDAHMDLDSSDDEAHPDH